MTDVSIEGAVHRTCQAVVAGNLAQVISDLTPEAMGKLMTGQAQLGGGGIPQISGYEVRSILPDGEDYLATVVFKGAQEVGLQARWRRVDGAWKIVDFGQPAG